MSEVILLERVDNLGDMGDTVNVKAGFARNYLLPQGKALRATNENVAYFEAQRKQLEAKNEKKRKAAEDEAKSIEGTTVVIIRQAAENGQLYGSVAARDISAALRDEHEIKITRGQVELNQNVKSIGLFQVPVALHPEVKVGITVNIARSQDEAAIQQETGKAVIAEEEQSLDQAKAEAAEEALEQAEEVFEEVPDELTEAAENVGADVEEATSGDTGENEKQSA